VIVNEYVRSRLGFFFFALTLFLGLKALARA
jgi:hypothetical protein